MTQPAPTPPPSAPSGVVVTYRGGTRVPCEIYYVGIIEGLHTWLTTQAFDVEYVKNLHIDVLPAKTSVRLRSAQAR